MKKSQTKLATVIITLLIMTFILPIQVFGTNEGLDDNILQIVKTDDENYIIYIKDLQDKEFEFEITQSPDTKEIDLNYEKSLKDDDNNNVIFITNQYYKEISENDSYLYVRSNKETIISGKKLEFNSAFKKNQMEYVEKTTKRIETELITNIVEKDEIVNDIKIKTTVGGLKLVNENSKYYYTITKLPTSEYDTLKQLADKINEEYETIDMYSKIKLAKEFYDLYNILLDKQEWKEVENFILMQPNDAQKGEQYIVYLKEINNDGIETTDIKIMTSYREDEEEKIPARTENVVVKETTKLPITGDSFILFVILGIILFVAVIVFIRMKKLQNKEEQ